MRRSITRQFSAAVKLIRVFDGKIIDFDRGTFNAAQLFCWNCFVFFVDLSR